MPVTEQVLYAFVLLATFSPSWPREPGPCQDEPMRMEPPGYTIASEMLMKSMNFSVDPCVDFYEFTCGNWEDTVPNPNKDASYSQFTVLSDKVKQEMKEIFESSEVHSSNSTNALKAMYRKCVDMSELNQIGGSEMIKKIKGYGGWPMLDSSIWSKENFSLTTLLINIYESRRMQAFVYSSIKIDNENASRRVIEFSFGSLAIGDPGYYLDKKNHEEKINAFRQFLIRTLKLFKSDANLLIVNDEISKDVDEIIELDEKLALAIVSLDYTNSTKPSRRAPLSHMKTLMPLVDWFHYFYSIAPTSAHSYITADPEVFIRDTGYLKRVNNLLNSTDPRIITNYVYVLYAFAWLDELGDKYAELFQDLNEITVGKRRNASRWEDCIFMATQTLQFAAGGLYVKKAFNKESKNAAKELVDDLIDAFHDSVNENDWIDSATKTEVLDKAKHIVQKIGYPDFILDDDKLDDYYDGMNIGESDSLSQMVEKFNRWRIKLEFNLLMKPVDRTEFNFNAGVVAASYNHRFNSIELTAAVLQAPFFHHSFPKSLIYGGIGTVIGHEITHGFDNIGHLFDAIGNTRDWWSSEMKKEFDRRSQCFIDQYNKIEVPGTGLQLNGITTLAENIADNGGVKHAFRAYKKYLKKFGEEKRIEGLEEFSDEQMFFISFGMVCCSHLTNVFLREKVLTHRHPPDKYRVNRVLANHPEFAVAFHCGVGTPMNSTERCALW